MPGWKFWEKEAAPPPAPLSRASDEAQFTSEQMLNKDEIEGFGPRSSTQRTLNAYKAMGEGDMRRVMSNINDLQGLDRLFAKEFEEATLHLERRKAEESKLHRKALAMVYEDLGSDRVYQHWQKEQEDVEKRLGIHWVDKLLDRPYVTLVWSLRLWTTVGLAMGLGRTAYLWRTIDKRYAKVHGVTLPSIATFEVSLHTMKGAGAAFCGAVAAGFGDAFPHMCYAIYTRDPVYHSREWKNIMGAGTTWGLASFLCFAAANYKYFGVSGIFKFAAIGTAVGAGAGAYIGKKIYQPYVDTLTTRYDDPHWRPWHERVLQRDGSARFSKGRFR